MKVNEQGKYEGIVNGRKVCLPRVTTIIGEFLEDWEAVPAYYLEKAAKFGQAVHTATEYDDEGVLKLHTMDVRIWPCVKAWRKFKQDFDVKLEAIEPVVYSMKHGYAGRIDRIGTVKGVRSVIDIKTAKHKATHDLQVAAYLNAWNELNPRSRVVRRYLVELRRDGTYRVTEMKGAGDFAIFLSAVALYKWKGINT
jgi:hypothetical protein